ncbi:MAG: STAS domain-containing protein, partial [Fibrobacteres bacterium]|nr:STAS domain-containing protein [Fibrobacterota bacterium]
MFTYSSFVWRRTLNIIDILAVGGVRNAKPFKTRNFLMEIRKEHIGPYTIFRLSGNLDHEAVDFTLSEIAEPGDKRIVVDIDNVDKIDSSGYGSLIKMWKGITYHGGELHLLCSKRSILIKLEELNLQKILHIFKDS